MSKKRGFRPLPGSRDDLGSSSGRGLASGRFTDTELTLLGQVVQWWMHRQLSGAAANPIIGLLAGVAQRGTCRTVNLVPAAVAFPQPLTNSTASNGSYLVHAFGVPTAYVSEFYSIFGMVHAYYAQSTMHSSAATISRAPSSATSLNISIVHNLGTNLPEIKITGINSLDIDWTVHIYKLEVT